MADDDNAEASIGKRLYLLDRDIGKGHQLSYFFDHHVKSCVSEQHKLLGYQLLEKEKEADITYDKSFSGLFDGEAKIDHDFIHAVFDSDAQTSFDRLTEDLATLANGERPQDKTRLFDFLHITRNVARLKEEQKIRNAPYDLYDAEAKGKLGSMTTYATVLSNTPKPGRHTAALAMLLSMLATGEEPQVDAALVSMAKNHGLYWDALLLARFYFGAKHAITRRVRDAWNEAVMMNDEENRFPMIKIAISLNTNNLKSVAQTLMAEITNKVKGKELIHAYRCLAISLAMNSSQLTDLEKKLEIAEVSSNMLSIWVTMLAWGNTYWAKSTIADIAKRAPLGDIPSDIYQIGLNCVVELVETLLIQLNADSSTTLKAPFTTIASKWRKDIAGDGEMNKLKSDNLGSQKVLYSWIHQLGAAMRIPLLEEPDLSMKMDCVFLAAEFLHEMLRWAANAPEGESLRLYAPHKPIKMKIEDEAIVVGEEAPRGRNPSVVSTRSTLTAKEHVKRKGDAKEELASVPIVQDTRSHNESRKEGNQQIRERTPSFSEPPPAWPRGQRNEQQSSNRGMNQRGGGDAGYGQANQQMIVPPIPRGQATQDYRKNQQNIGGSGECNGALQMNGDEILKKLLPNASQTTFPRAQTHAPPQGMDVMQTPILNETHSNGSVPTSASSSGVDLTTKRDGSSPSSTVLPVISQESLAAMTEPVPPKLLDVNLSTETTQSIPTAPVPDLTTEQTHARLDESTRNASASGQPPASPSIPQQPTMGTAAVNKARERRSLESVQQTVEAQQMESDSVYNELMEKEEHGDERPMAPEPGEMNRLFTGNSKGQSTLPLNLPTGSEQDTAAGTGAPTMIMQPAPPLPAPVAAEPSPSSLELTKLTPPALILQTEENETYDSSSADSILSPITEASQETFGTGSRAGVSESDGPGLVDDSTDTVFNDCADHKTNPLEVDVGAQTANRLGESSTQLTPHLEDLISNTHSQYQSAENILTPADSLTLSPLAVTSPLPNTTNATESSDRTTIAETTSQSMEVRREAEDENQLHQSILSSGPTDEQHSQEDVHVQTAVPPEMPVAPTDEQQQMQSEATGFTSLFSDPPPVATSNEPVMVNVSVMPHFEEPAMTQSSRSETNEQQMEQSINEQVTPTTTMEQQKEDTMVGTQLQQPIDHDAMEESPVSTTSQDDKQPEVQERVTSCGVQYKFSSPVKDEVVAPTAASMGEQEQIQEPVQLTQGNSLLDGFLSMMDTTVATNSQSDGTITKDEIDEHAAQRRQDSSEIGDSEFGSTSNTHIFPQTMSEVPSVPSSTITTPEPSSEYQQHYNFVPSNNGGDGGGEATTSTQMPANPLSMDSHSGQSEQQPSPLPPTMPPSNDGNVMNNQEPATEVPTYVDPFEHKKIPALPAALYEGNKLKESAPCFGTLGQNTQQQQPHQNQGRPDAPKPQMIFTNSSHGPGQDQGTQNQNWRGHQNRPYGQHRDRGDRGGGRGNRGGRGGGGSGFTAGNNQQQQGNAFSSGDNGQQKNFSSRGGGFGGQDVRAQFPRGRGS